MIHLENTHPHDDRAPQRSSRAEADVLWVPVPVDLLTSRTAVARAQRDALATAMPSELSGAELVHVHTGMPTGWAVAQVLPQSARMVVTEHASYLNRVFLDPEARGMYGQVLERSSAVLPVSENLARGIRGAYPALAGRVTVVPNPVRFDRIPSRPALPATLSRWLYVGNLIEAKGVRRLLDAFAARVQATDDPDLTLVVVGDGVLRDDLERRADHLGIAPRVQWRGPLPPDEVASVLHEVDVLVHLSHQETFGLTVVEAAAAGLPVVATACGGPETTLAEATAVGTARLVPVGDDVEPVLAALDELERVLPDADPLAVRAVLEWRYGPETVAARLADAFAGRDVEQVPDDRALRVLLIGLHVASRKALQSTARAVLAAQGEVVVVTNEPAAFAGMGPGLRVVDVSVHQRRMLVNRAERAATKVPGLALGAALRVVRRAAIAAPAGRPAGWLDRSAARVAALQQRHREAAQRYRRGRHADVNDHLAPWSTARYALAGPLHDLDLSTVDIVVTPDHRAVPLAWRLVQREPGLEVRGVMSRPQVARAAAAKALRHRRPTAGSASGSSGAR